MQKETDRGHKRNSFQQINYLFMTNVNVKENNNNNRQLSSINEP